MTLKLSACVMNGNWPDIKGLQQHEPILSRFRVDLDFGLTHFRQKKSRLRSLYSVAKTSPDVVK